MERRGFKETGFLNEVTEVARTGTPLILRLQIGKLIFCLFIELKLHI